MICLRSLCRKPYAILSHIAFLLIISGSIAAWLFHDSKNIIVLSIVFGGYGLYTLSGLLSLGFYFRRRVRNGKRGAAMTIIAAISFLDALCVEAAAPVIPAGQADTLAFRQVLYQGRAIPFSTICSQLTRKLTGKNHVGNAGEVQFVSSMVLYPEEWMRQPILKVKGRELRRRLGMEDAWIAPASLYDSLGEYKLAKWYVDGTKPLDNEILEVDEKLALISTLLKGELFTPLTEDDPRSLSPTAVKIDVAYDNIQPWRIFFMLALTCGILGLLLPSLFPGHDSHPLNLTFSCLTSAIALISYIWLWAYMGRAPLAGHNEIMIFLAMASAVIANLLCVFNRNLPVMWPIAEIMAGGFAMAGWVGMRDAMVSPLMPALDSPWLSVHVSVIMTSYVMLILTLPAAIALYIISSKNKKLISSGTCKSGTDTKYKISGAKETEIRLYGFILDMLRPGIYLLGLGIITGSIWADTAWGRFWAWDPKETWALITWLLYSLPLHFPYFKPGNGMSDIKKSPPAAKTEAQLSSVRYHKRLALYLILPFLSILMTYFGTALMPGLHSYA